MDPTGQKNHFCTGLFEKLHDKSFDGQNASNLFEMVKRCLKDWVKPFTIFTISSGARVILSINGTNMTSRVSWKDVIVSGSQDATAKVGRSGI